MRDHRREPTPWDEVVEHERAAIEREHRDGRHIDVDVALRPAETTVRLSLPSDERWTWTDFRSLTEAADKVASVVVQWRVPAKCVHVEATGNGLAFVEALRDRG